MVSDSSVADGLAGDIQEARQGHLTESELWPKGTEEAHGHDAEYVDEDDGEGGIDESEFEDWDSQCANGKGGNRHVGREPLEKAALATMSPVSPTSTRSAARGRSGRAAYQSANLAQRGVSPLVAGHPLDATLLDAEPAGEALELGVQAVAGSELVLVDGVLVAYVANGPVHVGILLITVLHVSLIEDSHHRRPVAGICGGCWCIHCVFWSPSLVLRQSEKLGEQVAGGCLCGQNHDCSM